MNLCKSVDMNGDCLEQLSNGSIDILHPAYNMLNMLNITSGTYPILVSGQDRIEFLSPYDCSIETSKNGRRNIDIIESFLGLDTHTWIMTFIFINIFMALINVNMKMNHNNLSG